MQTFKVTDYKRPIFRPGTRLIVGYVEFSVRANKRGEAVVVADELLGHLNYRIDFGNQNGQIVIWEE